MTTQEAPPGDTKKADVLTSADNIGVIELKSDEDLEQRKWFNMAMRQVSQDGVQNVQCAVKEEVRDTLHAELCNIYIHAIRMSVTGKEEARKHFFINKELEGKFNQGTLMKTRHNEKDSWSIVSSKTIDFRLKISTPKELQEIMNKNSEPKLIEAKRRYCAILASLNP